MGRPEQINSGEKLAHMWLHESERVYGDRLDSPEDLKKYNDLAQGQARKIFSQYPVDKFYAKENADPLVFCHFCEDIEEHTYDQVRSRRESSPGMMAGGGLFVDSESLVDVGAVRRVRERSRLDGVNATSRHRDAVAGAVRESTRSRGRAAAVS